MTHIDFFTNVPDKIAYVCRLIRKAHTKRSQLVIFTRDHEQLMALDKALWEFSDIDFLPHVIVNDPLAAQTTVILTDNDRVDVPHHQVLVNLSGDTPVYFARFERMIEIIAADEADTTAGRERYAYYKQRGYSLTHHVAEPA